MLESGSLKCQRCGSPLRAAAPEGLCPRCLLAFFLSPDADGEGEPEGASPSVEVPQGGRRRVGDYEILSQIARGGMGIVYRARDLRLQREVALKLVAHHLLPAEPSRRRFQLEAEAVAKLDHPNIVQIYAVGEDDGQPFLAMKLGEGGSLADRLRETDTSGRPAVYSGEKAARLMAKIARGVHHAHERGVLHRDLKPHNIILDTAGEPMITDFGLARLVDQQTELTATGALLGTPAYVSPEQVEGKTRQLTTASDLWSLGAMLYELLSGSPPFRAETPAALLRQICVASPPRFSPELGVHPDLATICFKCLEKDPTARYASALALAEDLERWLRHEPILARPASVVEQCRRWAFRNPLSAGLIGVALCSLLGTVFVLVHSNWKIRDANRRISQQSEERRQQAVRISVAEGVKGWGELEAFRSLLWFAEALGLDEAHPDRRVGHRLRFESTMAYLPRLKQFWTLPSYVGRAAFAPDGHSVALGCQDGTVLFKTCATGDTLGSVNFSGTAVAQLRYLDEGHRVIVSGSRKLWSVFAVPEAGSAQSGEPLLQGLAFQAASESGRYLAHGTHEIVVVDAQSLEAFSKGCPHSSPVSLVGFLRDDDRLFTVSGSSTFTLWNFKEGRRLQTFQLDSPVLAAWVTTNGKRLVAIHPSGSISGWDIPSSAQEWITEPRHIDNADDQRGSSLSPDGRWLVTGGNTRFVQTLDVETGKPVSPPFQHQRSVTRRSFHPTMPWVLSASFDGTAVVWGATTGVPVFPSIPHGSFVLSAAFSPEGRRLLTGCSDGTVRLWELPPSDPNERSYRLNSGIRNLAWSPDGRELLMAAKGGTLTLMDLEKPSAPVWEENVGAVLVAADYSPDGRFIVAAFNKELRFWDARTRVRSSRRIQQSAPMAGVSFDRTGRRVVTTGADGRVRVWEFVDTGEKPDGPDSVPARKVGEFTHGGAGVMAMFSPSEDQVLSWGLNRQVSVWDLKTGQRAYPALDHPGMISDLRFSPDGQRFITGCWDRSIFPRPAQVWELATGKKLGDPLLLRDGVLGVDWSPDQTRVVVVGEDVTGQIWDARSWKPIGSPLVHRSDIPFGRFSPDSQRVVTISSDGAARVWDAMTGEMLIPPIWHEVAVNAAAFSPDGQRVATGAENGWVHIWHFGLGELPIDSMRALAELMSSHELTPEGAMRPLSPEALRTRWDRLRRAYPKLF